jgi:lycopene cyclase domain-containing protein
MPECYTYLAVDLGCLLVPFITSFHPRFRFVGQWRFFLLPCLLTALFFIAWDALFTRMGVWSFSHKYTLGVWLAALPLEEHFFFICIPYACVFTYYCIKTYIPVSRGGRTVNVFSWVLVVLLAVVAITHAGRLYTSVTFILLAAWLAGLLLKKVSFLPAFYLNFVIILIPFFISNGILTGGFIGRTVVSYNPQHNLGFRLYTIPFEDVFYGMLLQLMNISGYEYLKLRAASRES